MSDVARTSVTWTSSTDAPRMTPRKWSGPAVETCSGTKDSETAALKSLMLRATRVDTDSAGAAGAPFMTDHLGWWNDDVVYDPFRDGTTGRAGSALLL